MAKNTLHQANKKGVWGFLSAIVRGIFYLTILILLTVVGILSSLLIRTSLSSHNNKNTYVPSTTSTGEKVSAQQKTRIEESSKFSTKVEPEIDCIGPDYKTFKSTETKCKELQKAWNFTPPDFSKIPPYKTPPSSLISYRCEIEGKVYTFKVKSESDGLYYCNDNKKLIAELKAQSAQWSADSAAALQKLKDDLDVKISVIYSPGPSVAPITYELLPTLPPATTSCYMRTQSDPNDRCLNGVSLSGEQCYQVCN